MENPDIPEGPASKGQTGAHHVSTQDDPMREMKITISGDQLTRVRFAGAKDLLADSETPSDRFEHCSPFKGAMWHTKASYVQYIYSTLHNNSSVKESCTLKYMQERYSALSSKDFKISNLIDPNPSATTS